MRERGRRLLVPDADRRRRRRCASFCSRARSPTEAATRSRSSSSSAIMTFCVLGGLLTWRVDHARTIRWFFVAYAAASLVAFAVASPLGENIARVRFAALPIAVLVLSLRGWRPLPVAALVLVLAGSWNLSPHAWSYHALGERACRLTAGVLAAGGQLPAASHLTPVLPRRGRRHRRPLGRRLPAAGGDPAHARLVPAGRLPAERGAVRPARRADVPPLAAKPRRAVRRADRRADRLQLEAGGVAHPQWPVRAQAGLPGRAHDDLLGTAAATDRDRARRWRRWSSSRRRT